MSVHGYLLASGQSYTVTSPSSVAKGIPTAVLLKLKSVTGGIQYVN